MNRKHFFRNSSLALAGTVLSGNLFGQKAGIKTARAAGRVKNIIFMVSDGMSTGTLNMADLLMQRKYGKRSTWLQLYEEQKAVRALMDTASANSLVTDSAAGSSAWGGGVRVPNGKLNVGANGEQYKPILQKFKATGKAVGCVTTVPIGHATPAGFCVNNGSRGDMDEIAVQYLDLKFDVMLGGGADNFRADTRKDKTDLLQQYRQKGYTVVTDRNGLLQQAVTGAPLLGVFYDGGLPYALDREHDTALQQQTPTLAEMTKKAIEKLKRNPNGFVMQVEGGKVDWGAHSNDAAAMLYDQIAFDEAIKVAIDFAAADGQTLVIMTTDHGNANPGLFYGKEANRDFDRLQQFQHTNDWILNGITRDFTEAQVMERLEAAQGFALKKEEAAQLLKHYTQLNETGVYNTKHLPFRPLAAIQQEYLSIGWGAMDHSADYVELAMYGPGKELLKPFVKNTDLHHLMLQATGVMAGN
ncbi:alkaline phosphatase [Niabella beijingensis]|uniref:alkaline phosphatase n=1 Tax=Niabella beijingensis TaxID=2872700 RepID=UPI001CBB28E2|nr:alkaline phosphatase [Niabella beijingensis]MBZ4192569.1 alkaline phosphatase [Niabella beijingensis]